MLKLEKISRTRDINITVRAKKTRLNGTFFCALAMAMGLHGLGAAIFHISPFKIGYQESIYPPVTVAIDLGKEEINGDILTHIDEENEIPTHLILPTPLEPLIPSSSPFILARDLAYVKEREKINLLHWKVPL
jgi:hypothetical protein